MQLDVMCVVLTVMQPALLGPFKQKQRRQLARLVEAVAKNGDGVVVAQLDERGQQLQLLVRAHANALPPDGVHLVLWRTREERFQASKQLSQVYTLIVQMLPSQAATAVYVNICWQTAAGSLAWKAQQVRPVVTASSLQRVTWRWGRATGPSRGC